MKSAKLLFVMVSSIAVAACGGGGGSSPSASNDPPVAAVKISGTGAKGIIKNAVVTAYELNASGATVRTVGTGVTDASGKYSLTINSSYAGGPLKLELTAKNDGSSKMVCDVAAGCGAGVAFGQDYTLSPAFKLGAYQAGVSSGSTVTTQITPYTNMVVARVDNQVNASTALNNDLIAGAISQVNQIVGINISTTEPLDITNASAVAAASADPLQSDALQYAAFNAGIGNLAFASGVFETNISNVASSFADGQFSNGDSVSIGSITAAVNAEAQGNAALNTTMLTATLASITANTTGGTFSPTVTPAATLSAVAQARALVSQTRTWSNQIAALKTPADAFGVDVDTASAVINSNSSALGGVFGEVLGMALKEVNTQAASASGLQATAYSYPISHWTTGGLLTGTGSVTVVNNSGKLTFNVTASNLAGVTCAGTITTDIPATILNTTTTSLDLATSSTLSVTGTASISSPSAASITLTNAALVVVLKAAGNTAALTSSNVASVDFNGGVTMQANGVTFTGTGKYALVAQNFGHAINSGGPVNARPLDGLSLSEVSLSGAFTGSKGTANASASIKFNNAANFDTIGLLNYQPIVWVSKFQPGDPFGVAIAFANATGGDTLLWGYYDPFGDQTCGMGSSTGLHCLPGDAFGALAAATSAITTAYLNPPPSPSVQNVYVNYDSTYGTSYGGMLTYPAFEDAINFANATITVSSDVTLTGSPKATLTVTANRTAYGGIASPMAGDAVAILTYSGQSVKFEATNTGTAAGTLTITNPDGVKLVLNGAPNSNTGTVSVNGTQVGTIDSGGAVPLIYYTDGTFESLNK